MKFEVDQLGHIVPVVLMKSFFYIQEVQPLNPSVQGICLLVKPLSLNKDPLSLSLSLSTLVTFIMSVVYVPQTAGSVASAPYGVVSPYGGGGYYGSTGVYPYSYGGGGMYGGGYPQMYGMGMGMGGMSGMGGMGMGMGGMGGMYDPMLGGYMGYGRRGRRRYPRRTFCDMFSDDDEYW